MILDAITKKLRIVLGEAKTTSDCPIVTSWAETSATSFLGGNTNILSNGTTPVIVVDVPSSGAVVRDVREVRFFNADTVPHTVTLQLYDGSTAWTIAPAKVSVAVNGGFVYTPESGITVTNPSSAGITVIDGDGTTINGVTSLTFAGPIVTGSSPNATATLVPQGELSGCGITIASTTSFTVASGQGASSDNTTLMTLASGLTKLTGGTWVAGNNQNGLDTGSISANTWYHVYLIFNPSTLVTDVLFSLSATSPSVPSGFTKYRRLGSIRAGGGGSLFTIYQNGDRFDLSTPINQLSGGVIGATTAQTVAVFVPTGVIVEAILQGAINDTTASNPGLYISSLQQTDQAVAAGTSTLTAIAQAASTTSAASFDGLRVITNTSGQIRYRTNSTTLGLYLGTTGYIDRRGRG